MSVENYYDVRGEWRLNKQSLSIGSESVPAELRSSYVFAENIVKKASKTICFLDLCCGDGIHSILPAHLGHSVTGVDLSLKSIEAARWLAEKHQVLRNCQFQACDASRFLSGNSASFDIIFISGSLYYFNLDHILPAIHGALKPGGAFICIGTNGDNFLANIYRLIKQKLSHYRDEATMNKLLKQNDWRKMKGFFPDSQLYFFSFLTLFAKIIPARLVFRTSVICILERLDQKLLQLPLFWRFGFKYLFWGRRNV